MRYIWVLFVLLLSGCVSYYGEYEREYYIPDNGYSYYNAPLRLRGLSEQDFYMIDNYPRDYVNTQFWSGLGSVGRFAVKSIFESIPR